MMVQSMFIRNVSCMMFRRLRPTFGASFGSKAYCGKKDTVGPILVGSNQLLPYRIQHLSFQPICVQVNIGQVTLGHMHQKGF